jgi:SAM-dependent methyltransferase
MPEIYSQRTNPAFEAELATRTASGDAAFLLPRVLDAGCGPGSITLGLASAVAPGEVVGIDVQSAQAEQARARALEHGISNAGFETASIYEVPFPNGSFDVAFANGVLMHLREPARALAELRRVLRPGGIAAIRDPDFGALLFAPASPLLERWLAVRVRVRLHNGGDPFLSRHYRRLLLEAGFARPEASASVESAGSPEETRRQAVFLRAQLQGFVPTVLAQGWMDQATVDAAAAEIDSWAQRPDAFSATTWCEALGWVS